MVTVFWALVDWVDRALDAPWGRRLVGGYLLAGFALAVVVRLTEVL